ncbi:MAG: hypothetical protein NC548_46805 [Lachnospiraceae bacterium]|nr:hypothetical protein [Lachnospiraceae bacterium]
MSQISSINFKKSVTYQVFHNSTIRPNYAIGGELECNIKGYDALALKRQIIENAIQAYSANKSPKAPKFKTTNYEWSAVCNIKPDTTMQDLERLAEHFNKKYGFQCYQIAIHRDEGHINEKGEKVINHHAHLEFITLDKKTGKQCFKMRDFPPSKMRQIQTEVAEILQMQRGQDKRISGTKRIEPRAYAKMKEDEKQSRIQLQKENQELSAELLLQKAQNAELKRELLSAKEVKSLIENFRKDSIGKGLPKEFYRDLSEIKKEAEPTTKELLESTLQDLLRNYQEQGSKAEKLEAKIKELELKLQELERHKQELIGQLSEKERRIYDFATILEENLEPQEFIKITNICLALEQKSKLSYLESNLTEKKEKVIPNHTQTNKNDLKAISDDFKHKYIKSIKDGLKKMGITGLAAHTIAEFQYAQDTGTDYTPPKEQLKLIEKLNNKKDKKTQQNKDFSRGR